MKILQFTCTETTTAKALIGLMVDQINTWARLTWLVNQPGYVTQKFNIAAWNLNTITPGLWWLNYGQVYDNIGDSGRLIADQMLGDGPMQGILKYAPLVSTVPDMKLETLEVPDEELEALGYVVPTPEVV